MIHENNSHTSGGEGQGRDLEITPLESNLTQHLHHSPDMISLFFSFAIDITVGG